MAQLFDLQSHDGYEFLDGGMAAPVAVVFDDDIGTIEHHLQHLVSRKFTLYITQDPAIVKKLYGALGNEAIYFFDMHMTRIKRIGRRDTKGGVTVGLTLICDITNNGKSNNIRFCSTLTEFESEPSTLAFAKAVLKNGQSIENIRKDTEFERFAGFVASYEEEYRREIKREIVRSNVEALASAFSRIAPEADDAFVPALFGYPGADGRLWQDYHETILKTFSVPQRERCEVLAYLLEGLILFFGEEDTESQRQWIAMRRFELGEKSVWDLVISGSMEDLFLAANFTNRVLG